MKLLLLLAISLLAACATQDTAEPPTALEQFAAESSFETLWKSQVGASKSHSSVYLQAQFIEDRIYTITAQGQITALAQANGERIRQKQTNDTVSVGLAASVTSNADASQPTTLFYGTTNGELIAVAASDFSEIWRITLRSELLANPVVQDDLIIVRTSDGNVQAIAKSNGERRWSFKLNVPALTLYGNSEPVVLDNQIVLLGSDAGRLIGLGLRQGNPVFETPIVISSGANIIEQLVDIDMTPVYQDNVLYVSAYQNGLYAINLQNGNVLWQHPASTVKSIIIDQGVVYLTDINSELWAVNQATGATIWNQKGLRARVVSAPALHNGALVVADLEGYLHAVSASDGRFIARKKIDSTAYLTHPQLLSSNNALAIQTRSGRYTALRLDTNAAK